MPEKKIIRNMADFEKLYFPKDFARKEANFVHRGEPGRCPDCGCPLPKITVIMPRAGV